MYASHKKAIPLYWIKVKSGTLNFPAIDDDCFLDILQKISVNVL